MDLKLPIDVTQLSERDLFALVLWREARGQDHATRVAVAWSIQNRATHGGWWGNTLPEVILKPYQYSSFNKSDPNSIKFPVIGDAAYVDCDAAACAVMSKTMPDPTGGATHYHDKSMDLHPPEWTKASNTVKLCNVGDMRFYRAK